MRKLAFAPITALLLLALWLPQQLMAGGSLGYTNVSNEQLKALLEKGVTLVDIRRSEEWRQTGIIEGSHKITLFDGRGRIAPDFQRKFEAVTDPDKPVALICRTGNRTRVASRLLSRQLGYKHIYNVERGITDWIRKGYPVVKE